MPKSTRTFIALPVPDSVGKKLASLQADLGRRISEVRWVESSGFHITLNFLGDVLDTDIHTICKTVNQVVRGFESFDTSVFGVGAFPSPERSRVIWAGIDANENLLTDLHHNLAKALAKLGYHSDEKRFHPHVTLGRIKKNHGPALDISAVVEAYRSWSGGGFAAREVVVYASDLGPNGPIYTALGRTVLKKRIRGGIS